MCLMIVGASAVAQDRHLPVPIEDGSSTLIPIREADEHLIQRKPPIYPPLAKAVRIEGVVRLKLSVNSSGVVTQVLEPSGHPFLVRAATEAAQQYRYRPFEVAGTPSAVLVEATASFSLDPDQPSVPIPFPQVTDLASVLIEYGDGFISLQISGNGLVEYDGVSGVVIEGKHQRYIKSEDVQQLLQAFRGSDFFSLRDDYSVGATDVDQTRTAIQIGNSRKNISDDWVQVPPALKAVQDAILRYSHSDQWTKGNADTVEGIIAETPSPSARREILSNVLPRAAAYGDVETVRAILAQGVDVERHSVWDGTALIHAAERGLPDMVAALAAGANPRARDEDGRSPLIFGAGSGNAKVVELLIAAGASGSEQDKYGDTALMAAAASGNPDAVHLLLDHGAKINARNQRRQAALLSAASGDAGFAISEEGRRRAEIPEDLVHRGAVVRMLLEAGADINARGWEGETALFSLEDDAVQELLRHHIDLEARDKRGNTALMETVSDSIAKLLIGAGAEVNAEDKKGQTALIMAAERNYVAKLAALVRAPGIGLEHRDHDGATALMHAQKARHQDCIRTLIAAGATL